MQLKCVPLDKKIHFPLMVEWWNKRGFKGATEQFTPERGFMVYVDEVPTFGAFLVETNANLAIIDYGASDPECSSEARNAAFDLCFRELWDLAAKIGYEMVSAASNMPSIGKRYEELGLFKADENVTIYGGLTCHKLQ